MSEENHWHLYSNGDTEVPPNVTHLLIASDVEEIPRSLCGLEHHQLLREVRFEPNSICHTIGIGAFYDCESLVSVRLAPSVQCIHKIAFRMCDQLKVVTVEVSNDDERNQSQASTNVTVPEHPGYHSSSFLGASSLTEVHLAEGIHSIGADAFSGCHSLLRIRCPKTLKILRPGAFQGCTNLETVHLNHGLTYIDKGAFSYCESLRAIRIPSSVENVSRLAFLNCKMLYSVEIEHGSELRLRIPFRGCSKLSVVSIPRYATFSSHISFDRCTALTAILPSDDQTSIQEKAINRFANHGLHDFCYHACHDGEDNVDIERLDETIQHCRFDQQAVVSSQSVGINPFHILASSACPRRNLFHAVLDRLPFQLLFREDKIGMSPLMLLADNPTAKGQDLLLSLIPKLVSFRSSHHVPPIEMGRGAVPKKQKLSG